MDPELVEQFAKAHEALTEQVLALTAVVIALAEKSGIDPERAKELALAMSKGIDGISDENVQNSAFKIVSAARATDE